ncbi:MAG: hypothetical protein HYS13_10295 [Planctomycetia bacterium]|nr:hypothetical protein [Planctomycetia bacterium]
MPRLTQSLPKLRRHKASGRADDRVYCIKAAVRCLLDAYGRTPASEFRFGHKRGTGRH